MDGHSYIYPGENYLRYFFGGAPLFPLNVYWLNDSLRILDNLSLNAGIGPGTIITRINSKDVNYIKAFILNRLCRDGKNISYAEHLFSVFFQAWLAAFFGFEEEYTVDVLHVTGIKERITLRGLSRNELQKRQKNLDTYHTKGLRLHINKRNRSALMTIPSFSNEIIRHTYKQNFNKELKYYFKQLYADSINLLFIDLRGNQGGELKNGVGLLRYIMHTPFVAVESFTRVKLDDEKKREVIEFKNKWNKVFDKFNHYHYGGRVILLTDGGSFSCSAIVANVFKKYGRGKLWGTVTGGSQTSLAGSPNKRIKLPNSGIQFSIPQTGYLLNKTTTNNGDGIPPDFKWLPSLQEKQMNDSERLNLLNTLFTSNAE
jgi:C-terminal processing protease CtpA/Prc